jgi:hypothetical protein
MPDVIEPGSVQSNAAMSSLEEQMARAQEEVNEQRETIANLPAESFEAGAARMQLLSMLENLAFLRKLCSG